MIVVLGEIGGRHHCALAQLHVLISPAAAANAAATAMPHLAPLLDLCTTMD